MRPGEGWGGGVVGEEGGERVVIPMDGEHAPRPTAAEWRQKDARNWLTG